MFRKTSWKNSISDAVSVHQDQALNITMFLLKSFGPTGFLLREEGEARNFKVCLGDPHTCTCPVFTKEKEPCKHICWLLLRKFKLPREHEYSFQHGLVERQILEVLRGLPQTKAHRIENDSSAAFGTRGQPVTSQEAGNVCRKMIQAQDVCPICQEELLERKRPVSYCRFGCGNNVHISCMKVWSDHQKLSDKEETVPCPLCREAFSSLKTLQEQVTNAAKLFTAAEREKPDRHLGVPCTRCHVSPITGRCFKCIVCSYFYLCEDCFQKGCHPQHQFASRTKRRGRWDPVVKDLSDEPEEAASQAVNDSIIHVAADPLPENVLACLPLVRVRSGSMLLDEGQQCRVCLQSFTSGQCVRTLPCHHKFHMDCVDGILRKLNSCPLDGYVIYNPSTWRMSERNTSRRFASCLSSAFAKPQQSLKDLFVPGVALQDRNTKTAPSHGSLHLEALTGSSETLNSPLKLTPHQFLGLRVATTDASTKGGTGALQKKQTGASHFDRQNTCSSNKAFTQHSRSSPTTFEAEANIREQTQINLFVGLCKPISGHTASQTFPARRAGLKPKRRSPAAIQDTNEKPTSELRVTGVFINTQHHSKAE